MKARITVKAYVETGNYGVRRADGIWSLGMDKDIARHGGLYETLAYYKKRNLNALHESLALAIILN